MSEAVVGNPQFLRKAFHPGFSGPAPTPTRLLSADSFNRANGALGSTDGAGQYDPQAWTFQAGTWTISTNRAAVTAVGSGFDNLAIATLNLHTANVDLSITKITATTDGYALIFRFQDANNFMTLIGDNTQLHVAKVVAGVGSNLTSNLSTLNVNDVLRVTANGSSIQPYKNGVALGSPITSTQFQTLQLHGMGVAGGGGVPLGKFDSWSASSV